VDLDRVELSAGLLRSLGSVAPILRGLSDVGLGDGVGRWQSHCEETFFKVIKMGHVYSWVLCWLLDGSVIRVRMTAACATPWIGV